jgi:putative pyruvate formate lyase activating enzyme
MAVSDESAGRFAPAYQRLRERGELADRVRQARTLLSPCVVCPRECRVDRLAGETGFCRAGAEPMVSSFNAHFGEESPLVGRHGSGTVFMTHCNLRCIFCQNCDISLDGHGTPVTAETVARIMLRLQQAGCHNINWVTPTHYTPQLIEATAIAAEQGLMLPIVYNCGGYESLRTLRLLDGIVDIYMPDLKYTDPAPAERLSNAPDYPEVAKAALREMHRQVGDLVLDERGIALRGLLVRHLVLPCGLAGTAEAMRFLAEEISPNTYVNVMAQYRPCADAHRDPQINRPITTQEYRAAVKMALDAGLTRLDERVGRRAILW